MTQRRKRLQHGLLLAAGCLAACDPRPTKGDTSAAPRAAAPIARCSDATITGDRVGAVRVGLSVDSVRAECAIVRDTTEFNEGEPGRIVYALVAGDTIRLGVSRDTVRVIAVRRPAFMTSDSIHVGMPLSRFLSGRRPRILVGEGKIYLRLDGRCGNSFGLSHEAFQHFRGLSDATLGQLPSTTIIDEILVLGAFTRLPNERCD